MISDLQDRLRVLVRERITSGELTGTDLANRAGFQQAHVSNFLNQRRGLSIEAMDRVMEVMSLEVSDLLPKEPRATPLAEDGGRVFDSVPVVVQGALLQGDFGSGEIVEFVRFKRSFLRKIRPEMENQRGNWQRFVLMKTDKDSVAAMRPRLLPGATLLIDRHYNSLRRYRRHEPNLYVVKNGEMSKVCYVELQGSQLTFRPENLETALEYVQLEKGNAISDYVVGRVAHISLEI